MYIPPPGVVVPVPLPPYAVAMFAAFALFGFPVAAAMWLFLCAASSIASFVLLQRVLHVSRFLTMACLLLPVTVLWFPYGELPWLVLFGALVAAIGLQQARHGITAAGLALMALQPHVAIGAWIAVALFVPNARIAIACAAAILLALGTIVHPAALAEYIHGVLPLHALAEVPRQGQFSTTWIVYALGLTVSVALTLGEAVYAQLVILGIAAGDLLRRRWRDPVLLVVAPLAFAVMGGTFVHASQIALALPLAAVLFTRTRGYARFFAGLAVAALVVPWLELRQQISGTPASGYLYAPPFPIPASADEFASAAWGRYVWSQDSAVSAALWLLKAPTFIGLLSLFCATLCALVLSRRRSQPA